jgi:hypothetical protein
MVPADGSNSEVGGGMLTAFADGTLKSKGEANYRLIIKTNHEYVVGSLKSIQ